MSTPERTLVTVARAENDYVRKDADPNVILIDGVEYQREGSWSGSFFDPDQSALPQQGTSGVYRSSTVPLELPFTIPDGYSIETYVLNSGGFTLVDTGTVSGNTVMCRVAQIGNASQSLLTLIGWRLVKS